MQGACMQAGRHSICKQLTHGGSACSKPTGFWGISNVRRHTQALSLKPVRVHMLTTPVCGCQSGRGNPRPPEHHSRTTPF